MSKLLIEESPLQLLPTLAEKIGLNEAIILQQLNYWIRHVGPDGRKYGRIKDDKRWIRNSLDEWRENNFRFFSRSAIHRTFESLEKLGAVLSRQDLNKHGYDQTKWYTIDYDAVSKWDMDIVKMGNPYNLNGTTIPETTTKTTTKKKENEKEKKEEDVDWTKFLEEGAHRSSTNRPEKEDIDLESEVGKEYLADWLPARYRDGDGYKMWKAWCKIALSVRPSKSLVKADSYWIKKMDQLQEMGFSHEHIEAARSRLEIEDYAYMKNPMSLEPKLRNVMAEDGNVESNRQSDLLDF